MEETMRHIISALVENKSGVLARIATLFAARGFNIDSLTVGETEDAAVSRVTITLRGDDNILEQIEKQLNKLIDTIKVWEYSRVEHVERDMALIKVKTSKQNRSEVLQIVDIFRGDIIDVSSESIIVEATGDEEKINAFIEVLRPFGIKEMARAGVVAVARG